MMTYNQLSCCNIIMYFLQLLSNENIKVGLFPSQACLIVDLWLAPQIFDICTVSFTDALV